MVDSLGHSAKPSFPLLRDVLILVVMEDSLGQKLLMILNLDISSLNPCCNGR